MGSSTRAASLLLIVIAAGSTQAYSARAPECTFPSRWEGTWFQSGVRQSILISKNTLSSKGTCLHNEGDKFLLVDEKSCYRCVVIHEKHSNVLQYKETYCHGRSSLSSLCSYITGDALLYSMFREEATSVACPFHGPMTFTYNRGHGRCSSPLSNVDTCTDESRLLFRYQACPDVPASESTVEELECLATWKEGSNRYLVGRLHNGHSLSNEDRYRCFVYERGGQGVAGLNRAAAAAAAALGIASVLDHEITSAAARPIPEGSPEIYKVAQSGDATCNGLFSPLEGSRTMTLTKASSPGKCWFPTWLTGKTSLTWHTLDMSRSYTFHMSNASLQTIRSNGSARSSDNLDSLNLPGEEEHNVKILCNSVKVADVEQNIFMIVAHYTVGCESGYMCMAFYKRDGHVVELQTGSTVSRMEEACSAPHYSQRTVPYVTLVTAPKRPSKTSIKKHTERIQNELTAEGIAAPKFNLHLLDNTPIPIPLYLDEEIRRFVIELPYFNMRQSDMPILDMNSDIEEISTRKFNLHLLDYLPLPIPLDLDLEIKSYALDFSTPYAIHHRISNIVNKLKSGKRGFDFTDEQYRPFRSPWFRVKTQPHKVVTGIWRAPLYVIL